MHSRSCSYGIGILVVLVWAMTLPLPAMAQDEDSGLMVEPTRPPVDAQVLRPVSRGNSIPEVALGPGEGIVVVARDRLLARDVAALLRRKLEQYLDAGKEIDVVAFAPNGEWVILAEDWRYYSNVPYFDSIGLRSKIEQYIDAGKRFDALAFTSLSDWVLVAENYRYYSHKSAFDRMGLRSALEELLSEGVRIRSIAITSSNGWVILSDRGHRFRNLSPSAKAAIQSTSDSELRAVSLAPDERLLVVSRQSYTGQNVSHCTALRDFLNVDGDCTRDEEEISRETLSVAVVRGEGGEEFDPFSSYTVNQASMRSPEPLDQGDLRAAVAEAIGGDDCCPVKTKFVLSPRAPSDLVNGSGAYLLLTDNDELPSRCDPRRVFWYGGPVDLFEDNDAGENGWVILNNRYSIVLEMKKLKPHKRYLLDYYIYGNVTDEYVVGNQSIRIDRGETHLLAVVTTDEEGSATIPLFSRQPPIEAMSDRACVTMDYSFYELRISEVDTPDS